MDKTKKVFMWKRKKVTEKVYFNRLRLVEVGKNLAKKVKEKDEPNLKNEKFDDGRRIVHLTTLANELFCKKCNEILSLQDRIDCQSKGAATIFIVKCRKCSITNYVSSDKKHITSSGKPHFDVNTKIGIGCLHSGMGNTQVNKFFAALNIPSMGSHLFKEHEREAGIAGEQVAKESCKEAALLEKKLTL